MRRSCLSLVPLQLRFLGLSLPVISRQLVCGLAGQILDEIIHLSSALIRHRRIATSDTCQLLNTAQT